MRGMGAGAALSTPIGDYNMPYLYLLLLISRLPFYDLYCIKIFSVIADATAAALGLAYLAKHFTAKDTVPLFVLLAAPFCPTTWLNSAYWGQCDSVYGALAIWGLYCGFQKKSWQCYLLFALSLSFKLQSVFLLPILAFLLVVPDDPASGHLGISSRFCGRHHSGAAGREKSCQYLFHLSGADPVLPLSDAQRPLLFGA